MDKILFLATSVVRFYSPLKVYCEHVHDVTYYSRREAPLGREVGVSEGKYCASKRDKGGKANYPLYTSVRMDAHYIRYRQQVGIRDLKTNFCK